MEFNMESQDIRTKSKIQSRRGPIALAENLGGVRDPLSILGNSHSTTLSIIPSSFYAQTDRLHLTTQYA